MTKEEINEMAIQVGYVGVENGHPTLESFAKLVAEKLKQEQGEPWGTYMGHRLTPKGTKEFWGFADAPLTEGTKLYTKPQTKEWVGLTEYDIKGVLGLSESWVGEDCSIPDMIGFAKAIDAKLKEKNT